MFCWLGIVKYIVQSKMFVSFMTEGVRPSHRAHKEIHMIVRDVSVSCVDRKP